MGTALDIRARVRTARKFLAQKVNHARAAIYEAGLKITGVFVENILKETSSVPTVVCSLLLDPPNTNEPALECFC